MKKILKWLGIVFLVAALVFALKHYFIIHVDTSTHLVYDWLGFQIPQPPSWIPSWFSLIPFLGNMLSFLSESFSLHGLIGAIVFWPLIIIGINLFSYGNK